MHSKLKKENSTLKNTIKLQQDTIKSFENNNNNQNLEIKLNKNLSGMFTNRYTNTITNGAKKRKYLYKWTEDHIARAIPLKSLSLKTYIIYIYILYI